MNAATDTTTYRAGDLVRAFHPQEFGVVRDGRIVSVGRKYCRVDFGSLRGGVKRVAFAHIVGYATDYR